jgi:hypothetical protein
MSGPLILCERTNPCSCVSRVLTTTPYTDPSRYLLPVTRTQAGDIDGQVFNIADCEGRYATCVRSR